MNKSIPHKIHVLLVDEDRNEISRLKPSIKAIDINLQISNLQGFDTAFSQIKCGCFDFVMIEWKTIKASKYELFELPKDVAVILVLEEDDRFEEFEEITKLRTISCIRKPLQMPEVAVRINTLLQFHYSNNRIRPEPIIHGDRKWQSSEFNNRKVNAEILENNHKKCILEDVQCQLENLLPQVDNDLKSAFKAVIATVKMSIGDRKTLLTFSEYFESTHPAFFSYFRHRFTKLTMEDIRYCAYLKMQMSNQEIAILLNINQESVRTHKYRLKKKMKLGKEINLQKFIDRQTASLSIDQQP